MFLGVPGSLGMRGLPGFGGRPGFTGPPGEKGEFTSKSDDEYVGELHSHAA